MASTLILKLIARASTDHAAEELANISIDAILDLYRNKEIDEQQAIASITHYRDAVNIRDWNLNEMLTLSPL